MYMLHKDFSLIPFLLRAQYSSLKEIFFSQVENPNCEDCSYL